MTSSNRRDEIQKLILALLVTHKDAVDIVSLESDYMEQTGERVPWRSFGHVSFFDFLQNMPNVRIERRFNQFYARALPTEKSNHISSLVANQRSQPKRKPTFIKTYRHSHYFPTTQRPKVRLSAEVLSYVVNLVKQHPKGITKDFVLLTVNKSYPYINICLQDLEDQLRELSHEIAMEDNLIYPVKTNEFRSKDTKKIPFEQFKGPPPPSLVPSPKYYVSDGEDSYDECDSDDNVHCSSAFDQYASASRISCVDKRTTCHFLQESVTRHQEQLNNNIKYLEADVKDGGTVEKSICDNDIREGVKEDIVPIDDNNAQILVNDRLKFRLEKLIQKYTNGIWCAELPEKFLKEYNIELKYTELGFNSVREFAAQLKDIFHCVQPSETGDCILYNAKEMVPENTKTQEHTMTLAELYCTQLEDDTEAMPAIVSIDTSKKLIPEGVMTIGETVGQVYVESLFNDVKPFVEVYVVEVFTPSFFWVQLRKRKKSFDALMTQLGNFYTSQYTHYIIPPVVLEKGLNCACIYGGAWHRGIIKSVKPDLQVTVLFYDYGTVKTYPATDIYYLDRKFSYLPAQAIPCGLINTQPKDSDQWTKQVTYAFAVKTSDIPLVATIASIDVDNNSMMVTLTNTLEDEDVHINDWLVEQNLAVHGSMVRMKGRNFVFLYYVKCRAILKRLFQISEEYEKSVKSANKISAEGFREKIALCDSRTILKPSDNIFVNPSDYADTHLSKSRLMSELSNRCDKSVQSRPDSNCASTGVEVTSVNTVRIPSGPKELRSLLEKVLSSDTTLNSSGSRSTTAKSKVSARQYQTAESKSASKASNSKLCDNPRLSIPLTTCEGSIVSKGEQNTKKAFEVQGALRTIKEKRIKTSSSRENKEPSQEHIGDYVPMKRFEYCFSPTNSVIDDAQPDKSFGRFKSACGGRGKMEPINWSSVNVGSAPHEPKISIPTKPQSDTTRLDVSLEPHSHKAEATVDVSLSENVLPQANPQFLNLVRHSLQPTDEAVHRHIDGNINKHQSVSELVLRRRKIYFHKDDKVIGVPQKMLNVFRGTSLTEADLVSQRKVDNSNLTEHKERHMKDIAPVKRNDVISVKESEDDTETNSWDPEPKKESFKYTKYFNRKINAKKSDDINSSFEVLPKSSESLSETSDNLVSSSDASASHLDRSEIVANDNPGRSQLQDKLCISEDLTSTDVGGVGSLIEELAESGNISTDDMISTNHKEPDSKLTSQKFRLLQIMERYKSTDDINLDSDDLSSADESDNFDHLTCNYIISKALEINGSKSKFCTLQELQQADEYVCQSAESAVEPNPEDQIHRQGDASDGATTGKNNIIDDANDEHIVAVQETAMAASVSAYAPVFNDVDMDSEDDDEWDAYMTSSDTQTISHLSPDTAKSNEQQSEPGLKISELDDTDISVEDTHNCMPDLSKKDVTEKEMHECNTSLIVSEHTSIENNNVILEKMTKCDRQSLQNSDNNTVLNPTHSLPCGRRKTLLDLLKKVESAVV